MNSPLAQRLENIETQAAISAREVAQLLNTRPETVSRWKSGKAFPQPDSRDLLLRLEYLIGEMAELYQPQEAHLWLFSPHKLLGGERPVDRISIGQVNDVLALIEQLKTGAYV